MRTVFIVLLVIGLASAVRGLAADATVPARRGGLVLQFDDGWSSWRTLVAPELERVGGKATGFVCNQYLHAGRITADDLRTLQDEFGWEIGSHAVQHRNAVHDAQDRGVQAWVDAQCLPSVAELRGAGLNVQNFVFPSNAYTPELAQAVVSLGLRSYRQASPLAVSEGLRPDGSLPGSTIDLTRYAPVATLREWVDMAHAQDKLLFLYGHRVLPDEAFFRATVVEVTESELIADAPVVLPEGEDLVLVPDVERWNPRATLGDLTVEGTRIRVSAGGPPLTRLTAPGKTLMVGPAYGTRLSDFRGLVEYASQRLVFHTVNEVVEGRRRGATAGGPAGGLASPVPALAARVAEGGPDDEMPN